MRNSDGSVRPTHTPNTTSKTINVVNRAAELGYTINLNDTNDASDYNGIMAVLNDSGTANSTVYFPDGTYNFSSISIPKSSINLEGQSSSGTIFKTTLNKTGTAVNISGKNNIVVKNIIFTSTWSSSYSTNTSTNNPNAGGPFYQLATGSNAYNITIDNVILEKYVRMGVRIAAGSRDIVVKNSLARNATDVAGGGAGYGFVIQGSTHYTATNNPYLGDNTKDTYFVTLDSNRTEGPYIRHAVIIQYWAHNNLVINNNFDQTQLDAIDLHGEDEYANEIAYNTVTRSQRAGIALGNSGAGHDKTGVYNWIHHNDLVACNWGITVEYGTNYTMIENNTIRDNTALAVSSPKAAIILGKSGYSTLRNNTISNNTISGFYGVYLKDNSAEGDETAGGPTNWLISGNTVTNSGTAFYNGSSMASNNTIQTSW